MRLKNEKPNYNRSCGYHPFRILHASQYIHSRNMKNIYYRRKGKSLIVEGKEDGKTILIWTLPDAETLTQLMLEKASFFTQEKAMKISEKVRRLDNKVIKEKKQGPKVPLIEIRRTLEKDDLLPKIDEEISRKLWELTRD